MYWFMKEMRFEKHLAIETALFYIVLAFPLLYFIALYNILLIPGTLRLLCVPTLA